MLTTRRYRCWGRARAGPRRGDCGRTCGMIARRVILRQQRFGSPTHRIVRANILSGTCTGFVAGCKRTPSPDLIGSIKRMAAFRKSLVGRMFGASFMTCKKRMRRPSRAKLWNESQLCMPLRKRSAAGHRMSGARFAQPARGLCSNPYTNGSKPRWPSCPASRIRRRRRTRRQPLQFDRLGETQWPRSRSVLARGPYAHRRAPHYSHRGVAALEHRRKHTARTRTRSLEKKVVKKNSAVIPRTLPHIAELITYGETTVGVQPSSGCIATSPDGHNCLAMLVRGQRETVVQLLTRLDQAIDKALTEDVYTDEVNY